MYDLVIIGAGPAGLTAGIYAKRAGLECVILEESPMPGGQILKTYEVDNYPGLPGINGFDLGMKFREHTDKLQCEFKECKVMGIKQATSQETAAEVEAAELKPGFVIRTDSGDIDTAAIIIATGADHAKLGILGEEKLTGMGVSYCATCDGAFFRNKTVAVIGGGDVALEDAIFLARTSAKVYVIHRRDEFRGTKVLQDTLMALDNVEIIWDSVAEEILGEEMVSGLIVSNKRTGEKREIPLNGVFIAVGIMPNSEMFEGLVERDKSGYIICSENCETSVAGIMAAGDVRTKSLRQVVTAVADGAVSVNGVQKYLMNS